MDSRSRLKIIIPAVLVSIAVIVAIVLGVGRNNPSTGELEVNIDTAQYYLSNMDYDNAIREFEGVVFLDPYNVNAYMGLSESYCGKGDYTKALAVLDKGITYTGDDRLEDEYDRVLSLSGLGDEETDTPEEGEEAEEAAPEAEETVQKKADPITGEYVTYLMGDDPTPDGVIPTVTTTVSSSETTTTTPTSKVTVPLYTPPVTVMTTVPGYLPPVTTTVPSISTAKATTRAAVKTTTKATTKATTTASTVLNGWPHSTTADIVTTVPVTEPEETTTTDERLYHHRLAKDYVSQGKYAEAISEYRYIAKKYPGYPDTYLRMIELYEKQGDIRSAYNTAKSAYEKTQNIELQEAYQRLQTKMDALTATQTTVITTTTARYTGGPSGSYGYYTPTTDGSGEGGSGGEQGGESGGQGSAEQGGQSSGDQGSGSQGSSEQGGQSGGEQGGQNGGEQS